ncbi:MAG: DUF58 domain-containing protein [Anaerolineae bacterium]
MNAPTRPRPMSWLALGALGLALVMMIFDPSTAWRMLLLTLVAVLGISYWYTSAVGRGLAITRARRYGWASVGDRVEEHFELTNDSGFPLLWVEIDDASTLPGYTARRVEALNPHSMKRWTIDLVARRRGLYQLGPMRLRWGDPFGLFEATCDDASVEQFIVYPPIARLPRLELPRGAASGTARTRRRALEWTTNVAGVRHYAPGDELRTIHWATSAKHDSLYVKEFDREPAGDVWIVIDLDAAVQAGTGAESTEEYAVVFASSMLNTLLADGRAVGLAVSGAEPTIIPPGRGGEHFWRILRELATVTAAPRPSLDEFLGRVSASFGRGLSVVLVTPSVSDAWLGRVAGFRRRGMAVHVALLDASTFLPPGPGTAAAAAILSQQLAEQGAGVTRIDRSYHFDLVQQGKRQGQQEYIVGATGRAILKPAD